MSRLSLLAIGSAAFWVSPAHADNAQIRFSGEASLVSDYRFRGVSLSDGKAAFQLDLAAEHESGLYAGVWASTIAETEGGARIEADPYIGYAAEAGGLTMDIMLSRYTYPSDAALDYWEGTATLSYPLGAFTPMLELNYAPPQDALVDESGRRKGNVYANAGLDYAMPGTPLTLSGRLGYERGAYDYNDRGGKYDWSLGARIEAGRLKIDLAYADTDRSALNVSRSLARATLVGSATLSF